MNIDKIVGENGEKNENSGCCPHNSASEHSASEQTESNILCAESQNQASNHVIAKRKDAIDWDDYFMAISFLSAMRSKDPSTQVGACIVNNDKRIVGIGYNGFPRGCSDDELPWNRQAEDELDTKYPVRIFLINALYCDHCNNCHFMFLWHSMFVMQKSTPY